jgi:hypothetical protein
MRHFSPHLSIILVIFAGVIVYLLSAPSSMLTLATEQSPPWLTDISYDPGTRVHTYRVEVNNNTSKFLIDGQQLLTVTDNQYLSGGQVGLRIFSQVQCRMCFPSLWTPSCSRMAT